MWSGGGQNRLIKTLSFTGSAYPRGDAYSRNLFILPQFCRPFLTNKKIAGGWGEGEWGCKLSYTGADIGFYKGRGFRNNSGHTFVFLVPLENVWN